MSVVLRGFTNVPVEVELGPSEAELDVVFAGPDGREWAVPAFLTASGAWRARFAAPEPGTYSYRTAGAHDRAGTIEIEPYEGGSPLYRHGRLRVAANRRTLEHSDGTPFLWLGDTWWMGLTKRLDWPDGFKMLARDRVAKGFNLIQIVAGPLPDFDSEIASFHPQQANEAGWPWEQGWTRINPAFYDLADLRIAHLVESGLVPCIVGMWGYYLITMGTENVERHWRNLVARYGAYPVVWCAAGEVNMPTYSHHGGDIKSEMQMLSERWADVMRYLREVDCCHNPITVHPGAGISSRNSLPDESVLDLEMLQTGHSGYASLAPTVNHVNAAVAREPRMPVVNSEVCYENIMGGSQQEVQRFLFWTSLTSGTAGHTYGAQGIWAMSSRDEPFKGTTGSWGDGFWQDVMHLPGSAQVALGRRFFERYPWHLFEPKREPEAEKVGRVSAFATGIAGAVRVYYLAATCMDQSFAGMQWLRVGIEPGAKYRALFFNPRTGAEIEVGPVTPDADGMWPVPGKPTMEDWVLAIQNDEALARLAGRERA